MRKAYDVARRCALPTLLLAISFPCVAGAQTPVATPTPGLGDVVGPLSTPIPTPGGPVCQIEPILGCPSAVSASIALKDGSPDLRDRMQASWRGDVDFADFGDPQQDRMVVACLYDETGVRILATLALPGSICAVGSNEKPCWTEKPNEKGFLYRDPLVRNDGLRRVELTATPPGRAKGLVEFVGRGDELELPGPQTADDYLADGPETALLQILIVTEFGEGACLSATLRETRTNSATTYRAGCDEAHGVSCNP